MLFHGWMQKQHISLILTDLARIITKERPIDENLGSYEDVDEAVQKFSQGALEHVTLYSIMQDPMTSCGCFECICGIEPFSNGVVIANREYAGHDSSWNDIP